MAKTTANAPAVAQTAPVAAPAAAFTTEQLAQIAAMLGGAPKSAKVAAPASGVTGISVTVAQLGKSWLSKQGNAMVAVRGTLADGRTVGGNLWIK